MRVWFRRALVILLVLLFAGSCATWGYVRETALFGAGITLCFDRLFARGSTQWQ